MALIERDNLALFHYSASEIWSDKRYDIWWAGFIHKKSGLIRDMTFVGVAL